MCLYESACKGFIYTVVMRNIFMSIPLHIFVRMLTLTILIQIFCMEELFMKHSPMDINILCNMLLH